MKVELSKQATKDLRRLPLHVVVKLQSWIDLIEVNGLDIARRVPGYHDEPLKGDRQGQRSIRLNKAYRAIYRVVQMEKFEKIIIDEVNKHAY